MHDWEALVRSHFAGLALEPPDKAEVIAEIATHLEEIFEQFDRQGLTEEEAFRRTFSQVEDWQDLRRRIQTARTKENLMSNRVKQFWLPSLLTLLPSMGLLALIQVFGPSPWLAAPRNKSAWSHVAPVLIVYLPWLLSLPLIGAMGAYMSNRAGGSQRAVFSSVIFPVLPYLVFILIGVPMIAILNEHVAHNFMFIGLFIGLFAWVLAPGAALLTGGLLAQHLLSRRLDSRRIVGD